MDRCPKDEPTAKNLVCMETSSHSREKLEKPVGGASTLHPPSPLAIRGLKQHDEKTHFLQTALLKLIQ